MSVDLVLARKVALDLLNACKATVVECTRCEDGMIDCCEYAGDPGHHEPCPCCSLARAAIAKVEERTKLIDEGN